MRALIAIFICTNLCSGALPFISFSDDKHHAFGSDTTDNSFEPKLKPSDSFNGLDSHAPIKVCAEVAIACIANAIQRQVGRENTKTLRYHVLWRHVGRKLAPTIDALAHEKKTLAAILRKRFEVLEG